MSQNTSDTEETYINDSSSKPPCYMTVEFESPPLSQVDNIKPTLVEQTTSINAEKRNGVVTADDVLNFIGFGPFQFVAFILSGLTYLAYGVDASIFIFIGKSVRDHWNLTSSEYAILPASTGIPNVFGAFLFSFLADRFGRIWPYAVCLTWIGTFSIVSSFANNFILLVASRCITSIAIGGVPSLTFSTIIEFLPVRNRGKVGILNTLIGVVGLCGSCGLAWWLIPHYPKYGWRYYIIAAGVPTLPVAMYRLVFYFESPRYLIARGKMDRAWRVFVNIAKFNGKVLTDFISKEEFCACMKPTEISSSNQTKPLHKRSIFIQLLEIFKPKYLRRTIPLSIIVLTESVGYLTSQLFLPDFLSRVGVGTYFTVLVTFLAQIPGILFLSIIVEWPRIGRLNSFRLMSILTSIFFILLAAIQTNVTIPVFLVLIYFSAAPILGLVYTYASEVYPTSIRSISISYFYILQAVAYLVGALGSSKIENVSQHWIFPTVWAGVFAIQFCAGLALNYESLGRKLNDILE